MLYIFPADVLCSDWTINSLAVSVTVTVTVDSPEKEMDDDNMKLNVKWTFFSPE